MRPEIIKQQISQLLLVYPELADDEILRADTFEGSTDLHETLRELERTRRQADSFAQAIKQTIVELSERKARFERRDEAMRALMFQLMEYANLRKLELAEATLSIRQGQPKVIITDESLIPTDFARIKVEPDKTKIKASLSAGNKVPGAELSNATDVLAIRTK